MPPSSELVNNVDCHAIKLVNNMASLFDVSNAMNKFSDIQVKVGDVMFYCHKLVLHFNSQYFANLSFQSGTETLPNIHPDQFYEVLQFMYTGEVRISSETVELLLDAADVLRVEDLKPVCGRFLQNLKGENTLNAWRIAEKFKQSSEAIDFKTDVFKEFKKLNNVQSLKNTTENMMLDILRADNLEVKNEMEVCDMLMSWIEIQREAGIAIHADRMLSLIRWSGISIDYVKSNLLAKSSLTSQPACFAFLEKVIAFLMTGVQFPGLQTFHRPSTRFENCLLIFGGIDERDELMRNVYRISLQRPNCPVSTIIQLPSTMSCIAVACTLNETVYITGTGLKPFKELWKWSASSGLKKCASMAVGRRGHSAAFVGTSLFVLGGGENRNAQATVKSVEQYDTTKDCWSMAGDLIQAVSFAACVTYKNCIYLFGGKDIPKKNCVSFPPKEVCTVQVYNPLEQTSKFLNTQMPSETSKMTAVIWNNLAILMGTRNCFIYNFDNETWLERESFKTGFYNFSLAIDNSTLFIAGGLIRNRYRTATQSQEKLTFKDEVMQISVVDVLEDQLPSWTCHCKLPIPAAISTYGQVTLKNP